MSEKTQIRKERQNTQKKDPKREWLGTILYVLVVCVLVFLVVRYVGQRTIVNGDSMNPTLEDGENLIMDKISYRLKDPERYDIVIFPGPEEYGGEYFIKRIIGLPGETVQIKDGKVFIDGEELTSDVYGITDYIEDPGDAADPIVLGDDEYFCLGDNRPDSFDCRYSEVGPVQRSELVGKVWIRIYPFSKFGKV